MTEEQAAFIESITPLIRKHAPYYGIKVYSPVISQAILESGWGKSKLAAEYHNYFGLKCGSKWTGKSVNMTTQEEYTEGNLTTIKDNFRVYDSMEDGVKGYFDFIQLDRYLNLKGITDPQRYLETIKADGYATSYSYVENNMQVIYAYKLTAYDKEETEMTYIIGSARISENGNAGWDGKAQAGDQTGKEISMQNFYVHSKGWYVIRAKSAAHAAKLAERMKALCNNDAYGYDQSQRLDVVNNGIDSTIPGEADCSSSVRACVKEATGKDPGNFDTSGERKMLLATGLFTDEGTYTSGMKLYTGDILVTCTKGHTAIVVSGETRTDTKTTEASMATTTASTSFKTYKVSVTASYLNIRKEATKDSESLGKLEKGHKVTIREEKDGWGRVDCLRYGDKKEVKGWIKLSYTKKV